MIQVFVYRIAKAAWLGCALVTGLIFVYVTPSMAQYRIDAGDVIEIVITGSTELRQRVAVQIDGTISHPLMGSIEVAGLRPFAAALVG